MVIHMDHEKKLAQLSLRAQEILQELQASSSDALFHPEYGRFMIEGFYSLILIFLIIKLPRKTHMDLV